MDAILLFTLDIFPSCLTYLPFHTQQSLSLAKKLRQAELAAVPQIHASRDLTVTYVIHHVTDGSVSSFVVLVNESRERGPHVVVPLASSRFILTSHAWCGGRGDVVITHVLS